jgi:ABC-type proline/glycine betaine transport system permease subunit
MAEQIVPGESHHGLERRTFATILSLPIVLVLATVGLVCLWALLTLSLIFALLACAALVAIGLPTCVWLARRSWRRRFPDKRSV